MKIIFDTNVLISSLLFSGFSTKVYDFCTTRYNLITSDWLLDELEEKLTGKFKLSDQQATIYLSLLRERMAVIHPFNDLPEACRDPDDNHVLQLAEYMQVDYIVTGDKDLLVLESYQNTKIVSPRQFYELHIE